jgi:hypothetical protein
MRREIRWSRPDGVDRPMSHPRRTVLGMDLLLGILVWGAIAALVLVAAVRWSRGGTAGRGPTGGRGAVGAAPPAAPRPPSRPHAPPPAARSTTERSWTAGELPEDGPRGDAAFIDGAVLGYYLAREHFDRRLEEREAPPAATGRDLGTDDDLGVGGEVAADAWGPAFGSDLEVGGVDEGFEGGSDDGFEHGLGFGLCDGDDEDDDW